VTSAIAAAPPPLDATGVDAAARRSGRSWARGWAGAVLVVVLGQMAVGLVTASRGDSPTYDEVGHIATAVANVFEHDVTWGWDHPPLVRVLSGVALRADGVHAPTGNPEYAARSEPGWGRVLLYAAGNAPGRMLQVARLPAMVLTIGFGLVIFGFARDLWGVPGGLFAAALYSVTPDVLAHGHLVTTDMAVSGFVLASCWMLWRALHRDVRFLVGAALGLGLALSSKLSALVFVPVFAVLTALVAWRASAGTTTARAGRAVAITGLAGLGALAVLWTTYLAVDPRLRNDRPIQPEAAAAHGLLPEIADLVPAPSPYRSGLRFLVASAERTDRPAMLFGERYPGGRPVYYPAALLVKTPLASLALWSAGAVLAVRRRRRDVLAFVVAPAAAWMVVAMTSNLNIGVRHVLPVVLLGCVLAGGVVSQTGERQTGEHQTGARPAGRVLRGRAVAVALLGAAAVSTWIAHPSYLAYSNEAFGGVGATYRHLTDSNVDWGQDLPRLRSWLDQHDPAGPLYLDYFGVAIPEAYGLEYLTVPPLEELTARSDGVLAVSATRFDERPDPYDRLGDPDAVVGGSILVFRLPLTDLAPSA
jgi:4-amino-4-deoxy-L-arabinose transferase-like glycosyltransferase